MPAESNYSDFVRFVRPRFQGRLIEPADSNYDSARTVFNAAIDRYPAVIARCADARDVALAIRVAAQSGLHPAIRGGGHSVAGWSTTNGLVIDLSAMKGIRIDPRARVVQVDPGVTWGELDRATAQFGLAVPGGIISTTGVAGLTLGGGVGWLVRKYGLACDNLVSAVVASASGRSLHASERDNVDLFWALRGGGGNFGVVTEFTYRLHPVATVFGGRAVFDFAKGEDLLNHYRELSEALSEDCTASIGFGRRADGRPVVSLLFCHLGRLQDLGRLQEAVAGCGPPIESSVRARTYISMQGLLDSSFPPGRRAYWRSCYLSGLGSEAIATLLEWGHRAPSSLSSVLLERYTGAASRVATGATAFPHRAEPYNIHILACWTDASDDDENTAWADAFWRALSPHSRGAVYVNFLGDEGEHRVRAAYGGNYVRLVEVKRAWDPGNMFRLNNNIDPGPWPGVASRQMQLTPDMEEVKQS